LSTPAQRFSKFIVVGDRILVKPKTDTGKTKAGLYLPPGVQDKEKVLSGYVIKVGPGHPFPAESSTESWQDKQSKVNYIPIQAKEGDLALFLRNSAFEIEIDSEKYFIVPQSSVLLLERDEDLVPDTF
jgi:co-chaperonin GroES (HSP10)